MRGISVFEAAARASSFQSAAEELNLTPSAVSHQIRLLEDILGVRLFDRVGRGVTLTPEGAEYARAVRQSIRRLRAATSDIRARGKAGAHIEVVRIEMPPSFAHCWLLPRLHGLLAALPEVDIRVNAQGSHLQGDRIPLQLSADAPADLQIVYGDRDIWEDRAQLLLSEVFQPYCAPAVLQRHGIDAPEKLPMRMLVSTAQNVVTWDEWLQLQGIETDHGPLGAIQMDPSHLAIGAAANGVGIVLESSVLVDQQVADGTLVAPFPQLSRPGVSYWVYTPSGSRPRACVEAIRDWFVAAAGPAI
ncbi:hypothetical protein B2G71_00110 [Novosphingobium sp. PC22D]|nr:hypothetical protein B2G71_00110 [Novosphingobium sp. PC22D]